MTVSAPGRAAWSAAWSAWPERGSTPLIRFMMWLSLSCGWGVAQVLIAPIALYFLLFSPTPRANARAFLARALGREPGWRDLFRHFFVFSNVVLDRVFLLSGRDAGYRIEVEGLPSLTEALAAGRGCILLGAHLGSFEVLRAYGRRSPAPVRPLMYQANNGTYNRMLERLDPALARSIIEIGTPDAMLLVQEALRRGEIVGILADRVPGSAHRRVAAVEFLGARANFPTSPMLMAARLEVPLVLFFGIRTGSRAYRIEFVPLALRLAADEVPACVARYAWELEARARVHPFNWFNFYDFWHNPKDGADAGGAAMGHGSGAGSGGRADR